ncbi:MAG: hypothetical protein KF819_12160 [Labilithrix sp.]|nr:hypothetical protein [Labilithrix sp.]
MDPAALRSGLDRLAALRGDPVKGLPATAWGEVLGTVDRNLLLKAAIAVVRELTVQEWADRRKDDRRPQKALEVTEVWIESPNADTLKATRAAAKDCTAARNETFGDQHRIPQAARSIAWTPAAKDNDITPIFEALASVEEELLARVALTGEYHRGPSMRRAMLDILRRVILPPVAEAVEAGPTSLAASADPVPYSADGHFELAQKLIHKKFGDVVVASVGETWIEVELGDGTKKRLAHKPA